MLDPACGSGNFLYVALERLHELEKEILLLLAEVDEGQFSLDIRVGPHMVKGIEINPFAQELAQVTVWIGHLQWHLRNGFSFEKDPVLKPIETIECRDAIVDLADPTHPREAVWPDADAVIGNPPFLGGKKQRNVLGDQYVEAMFEVYDGQVPREADLVTYWFEKARAAIEAGKLKRAGLLATNSIRSGASRNVLDRIRETGQIFMAWSDEPWVVEGAAVRISLVGFDGGGETERALDGRTVLAIHSDLTGRDGLRSGIDLTKARRLRENLGIAFQGPVKVGAFDIPGDLAREWMALPRNPNGRPNSDVLRPWANGLDITRRPRGMWIIDFGVDTPEKSAALYEVPFEYVRKQVKPPRDSNRDQWRRAHWWLHGRSGEDLRAAIAPLERYIATTRVAKHRVFVWLPSACLPDSRLFVFARDDDYFFGILHSRFHEAWSLRLGSTLEDRPCYVPRTGFDTFPFPASTLSQKQAIGTAAAELDRLRTIWLNPQEASRGGTRPAHVDKPVQQAPDMVSRRPRSPRRGRRRRLRMADRYQRGRSPARLLELNLSRQPA